VAPAIVNDAREEILGRVRAALRDVPAAEQAADVVVQRDYRHRGERPQQERLELLGERLRDYHATVHHVTGVADVAQAVAGVCAELGLRRVAVPPEFPRQWRPAGIEVVEDHGLTADELDRIDGAITGCAVAIAETGTLVLDGQGRSGRRVMTLVPDHHICVVTADQVLELVPEALVALAPAVRGGLPVTLVSGPSASSDIELERVEGVHGPRHLVVVIVG
jgi:L-lactate dehydrogenase complex protein LldG